MVLGLLLGYWGYSDAERIKIFFLYKSTIVSALIPGKQPTFALWLALSNLIHSLFIQLYV